MFPKYEPTPPIAIIGMGMRLPGGVSSAEEFWDLLINKRDGRCRVPSDRYNVDAFYGDKTHQQNISTDYGYFLSTNIKGFDTSVLGARRAELGITDPQLRLLLEVVWECIENAGQTGLRGTDTGVFVGVFGEDWHNMLHKDPLMPNNYRVLSAGDYALANMLSWEFDLSGPSMTLRTACSSSLSALHIACQSLYNGDCPTAIVAGSSLIMDPSMTMDMSEAGVLSPTGSCKTFDAAADGFARGEAVNAILLKPLEDAIRDGDPVRAVIRSTAVNSDGRTSHIGSPSSASQIKMIKKAYERAGIHDPSQTPFVECHGTGTVRGDPIEAAAVASVFGTRGTYIGSVKPNVGHGEGAAALTSIIKATLSLESETIPPNVNFTTPNPNIPFEECNLLVPVEPQPWPRDRCARISVSSFGIGGANGHVIIDSAASFGVNRKPVTKSMGNTSMGSSAIEAIDSCIDAADSSDSTSLESSCTTLSREYHDESARWVKINSPDSTCRSMPYLIPVSAGNETGLKSRIASLKQYTEKKPKSLPDVAYTLSQKRTNLQHRTFCIATNDGNGHLDVGPFGKAVSSSKKLELAFVFTGQGAQWAGMAKSLIESSAEFLDDIRQMDRALQNLDTAPSWSIERMLLNASDTTKDLQAAEFAQPLCTAVQIAIINFLARSGITPSAVIGHSSGEIAAAYAAEALTLDEAIICAYLRGSVTKDVTLTGAMAAIGMGKADVAPFLNDGVIIACDNSPKSVTISGDADAVDSTLKAISRNDADTFTRQLRVNIAYHSHHMKEIGSAYDKLLSVQLSPQKPSCPFYSTVSGQRLQSTETLGAEYWRRNLESPVLFYQGLEQLVQDMPDIFGVVEIGPHSALQSPIREIMQSPKLRQRSLEYIPTLSRNKDSVASILSTVGSLFVKGYNVDFSSLCPQTNILTDLPPYIWDKSDDVWRESRLCSAWRHRRHPHHELLGSICIEMTANEPMWRNILHQHDVAWLADHKVGSDVVFPVAGFVAMMGEAIRQVTGCSAYKLRNVMVKAALLMPNTDPVELITNMKPHRVTGLSNSSTWYDISISTFDGVAWVENCCARGKAQDDEAAMTASTKTVAALPRKVVKSYFYDRMQYIGLKYGPRFQGLEDISCHTSGGRAVAILRNDSSTYEAPYAVHPTTMDCCIQLCVVAQANGLARNIDNLVLPIMFDSITIAPTESDLVVEAAVDSEKKLGSSTAVTTNSSVICIDLQNGRCVPFNVGENASNKGIKHACRVQWLPDIECSNQKGLITLEQDIRAIYVAAEKAGVVAMLQMLDILERDNASCTGHLGKYLSWLRQQRTMISNGQHASIAPEAAEWATLSFIDRKPLLTTLLGHLESLGNVQATNVITTICKLAQPEVLRPIFDQSKSGLEFLLEGHVFKDFYDISTMAVSADRFLYLCGHVNPGIRVLEIGGGTAATSDKVLKSLVSENGVRMYSQYIFTDLSSGFFEPAKERLSGYEAIEYKALDIEQSPEQQGFELGSFDLVIASNVLHATSSIQKSLKNVRSLLRPGGRLYLQELLHPLQYTFVSLTMGLLPSWWVGETDNRINSPFISAERWDVELRDAGFTGNDDIVLDDEPLYHMCGHIITTAQATAVEAKRAIFVYKDFRHKFGLELASLLEQRGVQVEWVQFRHATQYPEGVDMISTIDLEGPFLADIPREDYEIFMKFVQTLKSGWLWLTRLAQIDCIDPGYGIGSGLFRTIRNELSIEFWTLELDHLDNRSLLATVSVLEKFRLRPLDNTARRLDTEYVSLQGTVHIGRYHWTSTKEELISQHSHDPKKLVIDQYGMINTLHWINQAPCPLQDDEVEVKICSVGLNFRDVMVAMGIVIDKKDALGLEASGVVTRVGAAVKNIKSGQRVAMLSGSLFTTKKIVHAKQVMPIPDHLSFEEAATIPVVYATATYAIMHLGQLNKDQSILIHSGAGGVGQAAIHICQLIGATIYVTVGSVEKAQYIMNTFGIPRERIFDSHSDSFLADTMKATNGRGVDMVLNSLSGELLHASWECVAKHGKMMEIGKRDMIEHGHLDLNLFQGNRTLYGIDVGDLWENTPEKLLRLVGTMASMNATGQLRPIQPIHSFPMENAPEAFGFMKKGQHIGKIVLNVPENPDTVPAATPHEPNLLSPSATYLMVGGLGGLGREVTRWLIERGARSFCFLSRSAGSSKDDQDFLMELETLGCHATAVAGSVTDIRNVERAIATTHTPIAGVFQMSMVLRDLSLPDMDYDSWRHVQDCKVLGTWNLHKALSGIELDFFILVSSICGVAGQPGQANYASANSFLDSFAQYRHSLGLPCSVVDLGAMEGIGFLTTRPDKMSQYRTSGLDLLQEDHLLESIRIALRRASPADGIRPMGPRGGLTAMSQIALGLRSRKQLSDPRTSRIFTMDARFRMYPNMDSTDQIDTGSKDEELQVLLKEVEDDPSILNQPDTLARVSWEIGRTLFKFLALPLENLDIQAKLESIGVDSLVSIEIRNWYRRAIGLEITVLEILKAGTIEGLGQKAISSLKEKYKFKGTEDGGS